MPQLMLCKEPLAALRCGQTICHTGTLSPCLYPSLCFQLARLCFTRHAYVRIFDTFMPAETLDGGCGMAMLAL